MILKSKQDDVIKEGENIQLSCDADAKPPVYRYTWFQNVSLNIFVCSRF